MILLYMSLVDALTDHDRMITYHTTTRKSVCKFNLSKREREVSKRIYCTRTSRDVDVEVNFVSDAVPQLERTGTETAVPNIDARGQSNTRRCRPPTFPDISPRLQHPHHHHEAKRVAVVVVVVGQGHLKKR